MRLDPIERLNLALAAGAVPVALAAGSPRFASSLALGAAFGALNFRALHSASRRMFAGALGGSGPWVALFGVRFVLLAVAVGLALRVGADPVALVLGLSAIVPATLVGAWRMRPPVVADVPALDPEDPEWERWDPWRARERAPRDEDES